PGSGRTRSSAHVDVRGLLRALEVDPGERRLAELGPAQKARALNRHGRTLETTTALLVQGSCRISRSFGGRGALAGYPHRRGSCREVTSSPPQEPLRLLRPVGEHQASRRL